MRDPNPLVAFYEWLVFFLERNHDTFTFDILSLAAAFFIIPFYLAMRKNPESKKHTLWFRLSVLPMMAFLIVRVSFA